MKGYVESGDAEQFPTLTRATFPTFFKAAVDCLGREIARTDTLNTDRTSVCLLAVISSLFVAIRRCTTSARAIF